MAEQSRRDFLTLAGATIGSMAAGVGGGVALLRTLMPQASASAAKEHTDAACPPGDKTPAGPPAAGGPGATAASGHGAATSAPSAANAAHAHDAQALLLTCMDFRLLDHVNRYMAAQGLGLQYDHVILAGAALGAVSDRFPEWGAMFWKHLELAKQLHNIKQVIAIDHRDCGAYRLMLGAEAVATAAAEQRAHVRHLARLRDLIWDGHPELEVELLLMRLDGTVDRVS